MASAKPRRRLFLLLLVVLAHISAELTSKISSNSPLSKSSHRRKSLRIYRQVMSSLRKCFRYRNRIELQSLNILRGGSSAVDILSEAYADLSPKNQTDPEGSSRANSKPSTHPWDYSKWDNIEVSDAVSSYAGSSDPGAPHIRADIRTPEPDEVAGIQGEWETDVHDVLNQTISRNFPDVQGRMVSWNSDGEIAPIFHMMSRDTLWINGFWLDKTMSNSSYLYWRRHAEKDVWKRKMNSVLESNDGSNLAEPSEMPAVQAEKRNTTNELPNENSEKRARVV